LGSSYEVGFCSDMVTEIHGSIKHMFDLYILSVIIRTLKNYRGNMFVCEIL